MLGKWPTFTIIIGVFVLGGCALSREVHQRTVYQSLSACTPADNGDAEWAKISHATRGRERRIFEREKIVDPAGYADEWCRAYQRIETEKYWGTSLGRTHYRRRY